MCYVVVVEECGSSSDIMVMKVMVVIVVMVMTRKGTELYNLNLQRY